MIHIFSIAALELELRHCCAMESPLCDLQSNLIFDIVWRINQETQIIVGRVNQESKYVELIKKLGMSPTVCQLIFVLPILITDHLNISDDLVILAERWVGVALIRCQRYIARI